MSVTAIDDIRYRMFAGYDDPSLPSGTWFGRVQLVGDASGGIMAAQLDFTKVGSLFNSRFYSLEDFIATKNQQTNVDAGLEIRNMGDPGQSGNPRIYSAFFVTSNPLAVVQPQAVVPLRGLFLGQQQLVSSVSGLILTLANSNGILVTMFAEGYFWAARAVNAPGGPSRPVQGLYSGRG